MKKILFLIGIMLISQGVSFSEEAVPLSSSVMTENIKCLTVFTKNNLFGLKNKQGKILIQPIYKKLIKVGDYSWIVQKKNRFGLVDNNGNYLVKPRYRHCERYFGHFAKLGNVNDFGLYDEKGNIIVPPIYSMIEPLFGGHFLVCRNYKYGVVSNRGKTLIKPEFDYIYMPNPNIMRLEYAGKWYEIEKMTKDEITLPEGVRKLTIDDTDLKVTDLVVDTGVGTAYGAVTATNYALKVLTSISPAYEETVDELMYSQGADAVPVILKFTWLPKFPFVYARRYYENIKAPNNGPLKLVK